MERSDEPALHFAGVFIDIGAVLALGHLGLIVNHKIISLEEYSVYQNGLREFDDRRFIPRRGCFLGLSNSNSGYNCGCNKNCEHDPFHIFLQLAASGPRAINANRASICLLDYLMK